MACEHRTEAARWHLASQLAALAWLASGGTVAGLDTAQLRILAVLHAMEAPA